MKANTTAFTLSAIKSRYLTRQGKKSILRGMELFQRLGLLVGNEGLLVLERARVVVVGVGGVGSWAAEALARSGVGRIAIVDADTVCESNVNRQIQALPSTIGLPKAAVLRERLLSINPACSVEAFEAIFSNESAEIFHIEDADYVIDAIDSLSFKLDLIETCFRKNVKLFSSMGMARKLDPSRLKTADIWETGGCPLARLVRQGLRKHGFTGSFTTVYSDERLPHADTSHGENDADVEERLGIRKAVNGSCVTVTASAGFILAGLVIQDVYMKHTQRTSV